MPTFFSSLNNEIFSSKTGTYYFTITKGAETLPLSQDSRRKENTFQELSGINLISNAAWDKKLSKTYQLKGYPRYVLIDKDGKIIDGWSEKPSDPSLRDRLQFYLL